MSGAAVYGDVYRMVGLALKVKGEKKHQRIKLPINDAPLLRALNVDFTASFEEGIKQRPLLHGDIRSLDAIHFDEEKLQPLYDTIRFLKAEGEEVLVDVSGIFYIMSVFLPFESWVKATKDDPQAFHNLIEEITHILQNYYLKIDEAGADYICMADGISIMPIVGKDFYQKNCGPALANLIRIQEVFKHAHLLICPKTFTSLKRFGALEESKKGKIHPTNCSITTKDALIGKPHQLIL